MPQSNPKNHPAYYFFFIALAALIGVGGAAGLRFGAVWMTGEVAKVFPAIDQSPLALTIGDQHLSYRYDSGEVKSTTTEIAPINLTSTSTSATTTLLFVGDIMLDRGVKRSIERNGGGDYNFIFHRSGFIQKADLAFANLEGPISDKGVDRQNLYSFRMSPQATPALASAGFDVLSVANNHMGDWGREAFVDTLNRLGQVGIAYAGGGINQTEAEGVKIVERNGVKYGFVGFTDVGPNDLATAGEMAGLVLADGEAVVRIVGNAASKADLVIASFHFGEEYKLAPSERQKYLARLAVDSGAKIVVGHHPHVVQPIEYYKDGVIAYSLGNFIFDQYFSAETMRGAALMVDVVDRKINRAWLATTTQNKIFVPELTEF